MIPGLILVLAVAALDWTAVAKGWRQVEYVAKPGTMAALFAVLAVVGGFSSPPLILFGAGILLSMAGDVFLMLSERWFIAGLVAFLLAHVAYIVGFNLPLPSNLPLTWAAGIAIVLALNAGRVLRRILASLKEKKIQGLGLPVAIYGTVITIMLLSALLTFFRTDWDPTAATLAAIGASLFYFSDIILAWDRFVEPIKNGRVMNMMTYHLGQAALVGGILIQFTQ
jgi:uncharacterized membrane protein YhhN